MKSLVPYRPVEPAFTAFRPPNRQLTAELVLLPAAWMFMLLAFHCASVNDSAVFVLCAQLGPKPLLIVEARLSAAAVGAATPAAAPVPNKPTAPFVGLT